MQSSIHHWNRTETVPNRTLRFLRRYTASASLPTPNHNPEFTMYVTLITRQNDSCSCFGGLREMKGLFHCHFDNVAKHKREATTGLKRHPPSPKCNLCWLDVSPSHPLLPHPQYIFRKPRPAKNLFSSQRP